MFYQEPQPDKQKADKTGFCGVKASLGIKLEKHQSCKCDVIAGRIDEAKQFAVSDMPNYCQLKCNLDDKCKGYSYVNQESCEYYTDSEDCTDDSSNIVEFMNCELMDDGSKGDLIPVESQSQSVWPIGGLKGCYQKRPLRFPTGKHSAESLN